MKRSALLRLVTAATALLLVTAGCTKKSDNDEPAATSRGPEQVKIALISGGAHPYFQPWRDAGAKAKSDFGIGDVSYNETAGWEQTKQNDVLTSMAAQTPQ